MTHPGIPAPSSISASALTASQDRARAVVGHAFTVLESAAMPVVISDPHLPDNPLIFVNAAFTRLTGFTPAEVMGRNCRFLQGPHSDPSVVAELRAAVAAGREVTADILNTRKDGSLFWNRMAMSVVRDQAGQPDFFIGSLSDVSDEHGRRQVSGASGVWEWDVVADRLYADAHFAVLFGLHPREAFFGMPREAFFANVHEEDRLRLKLALAGTLHGSELFSREFRIVQPDRTRWVSARGRLELDSEGRPVRLLGSVADITDQKRIEDQLRIAQTAGGVGTFEYVSGFGTVSVSDQFCRLIGVHVTDSLSVRTINAVVHPDEAPMIASGNLSEVLSPYREFRIRRADTGEERWLARRGEVRDPSKAGGRFVGVIYDVTEAKRAERMLKNLADTLEERVDERTRERDRLWNLSRDLFLVMDPAGRCRATNPAWTRTLGYEASELAGRHFLDMVHADDHVPVVQALDTVLAGQEGRGVDCRLRARDGNYVWTNWTAVAQGDEVFAIGRNIAQRRMLEDQLRQSQKMEAVGQLTGGIAHDFNNMLTGIIGSLDIIRRRMNDGRMDDVQRFMRSAVTSAERAASLTHRLLAFSRRQSLDVKAIDVNGLILSIDELLRRTLGEGVSVDLQLHSALPAARSDENQLETAILNLAINARDAMPGGGVVSIATDTVTFATDTRIEDQGLEAGSYVTVSVTDTGVGMSRETAAKAFEPFFTTKPIGQGTGLGLSMIYGFMRQSGGTVTIRSAEGHGTTVTLYLPMFEGPAQEGATKTALPTQVPCAHGERVLVVEDDTSVRLLVMEVLHELGYAAREAGDAAAALEQLEKGAVDLLVTDVGLPGMDGRSLADIAMKRLPNLRVLFMTAYAERAAVRSEFLKPGMGMISKPFTFDAFALEVRKVIARVETKA